MTIEEIRRERERLEADILTLIRSFEERTDCLVDHVDCQRYERFDGRWQIREIDVIVAAP